MRWTNEQSEFRKALRRFVEAEVLPLREELEFGGTPPYAVLRRYYEAFAVGEAAMERFERSLAGDASRGGRSAAETLIPTIELSRAVPGHRRSPRSEREPYRGRDPARRCRRAKAALGPRSSDLAQDRCVGDHRT